MFIRNSASWQGGGFFGGAGVQLIGCTFIENSANENGGGAIVGSGSLASTLVYGYATLTNCTFRNNSASSRGGGLFSRDCKLVDCTFESNNSNKGGGAHFDSSNGPLVLEWINCIFSNNNATKNGGGVSIQGSLILTNCTFEANTAGERGGGLICTSIKAYFEQCIFTRNSACYGGAVYLDENYNQNISNL